MGRCGKPPMATRWLGSRSPVLPVMPRCSGSCSTWCQLHHVHQWEHGGSTGSVQSGSLVWSSSPRRARRRLVGEPPYQHPPARHRYTGWKPSHHHLARPNGDTFPLAEESGGGNGPVTRSTLRLLLENRISAGPAHRQAYAPDRKPIRCRRRRGGVPWSRCARPGSATRWPPSTRHHRWPPEPSHRRPGSRSPGCRRS